MPCPRWSSTATTRRQRRTALGYPEVQLPGMRPALPRADRPALQRSPGPDGYRPARRVGAPPGTRSASAPSSRSCSSEATQSRTRRSGTGSAAARRSWADPLRAKRRGRAGVSWSIDETSVQGAGRWCYLYRAIDRDGALLDSMRSAHRDTHAARRFLRRLVDVAQRKPERVTTDPHPPYRRAIRWILGRTVRHRCNRYLNTLTEQSHRAIKQRV